MPDVVDQATRSRMMSGIRGKDTKPELLIRKALHKLGFRYVLHAGNLPGKPDLVFPKYRAVLFIHGCFWHGHGCKLFKLPSTRTEFWENKIYGNRDRDIKQLSELQSHGWRTLVIWECATKKGASMNTEELIECIAAWLVSEQKSKTIDLNGLNV